MKLKKIGLFLLSLFTFLTCFTFTNVGNVMASSSTSWNFKNSGFNSLGTISTTTTVDNLTLVATSSKTMTVKANSVTVDGTSYTYCLALGGSGTTSYRSVKIPVEGESTIKVITDAAASRTLIVANSSGSQLGTMSSSTTASLASYSYTGSSGYVYLYSSNSNINIYKIQVDFYGSSSGSSTDSSSSSSSTSSSLSWNFKDDNFKSLGTISSTTTIDDLTLNATSSKTMSVIASSVTVDSTSYTYCLALGGSGTTSYRSVKIPVSGESTIKVILNAAASRTLVVANSSGSQLGTMTASTTASLASYSYTGSSGYIYLYSSNSNINIYKIQVDSSSSGGSSSDSSSSSTTGVTSFSDLKSAISTAESNGGGTVYVSGTSISCTGQIALSQSNANVKIVGVQNSDGTYPILDFTSFRSGYIGSSTSDSQVGIRITGSYYTIENLIIQKAPDNGIQIKGSSAGNNTISNCVVRYNNDAGVQITAGAYNNTVKYVCSYRNCDVYTLGGNADGFAPKLGAGSNNKFQYCYAWDNSDDGWDSYDKSGEETPSITYENCACWHNGDPTTFTGEWDFSQGNSLDKNLLLVELICNQSSSFASNYSNGTLSLPTASFIATSDGTYSISSWKSNYGGNPNGFKFGSAYSTSSCIRTVKNCLAFDHEKKGFDNNNSAVTASFTNCVAFDNGYNYYISPFTITSWSNVMGFSGSSSDKLPSGYSVTTPSSSTQSSIRSVVDSTKDSIISICASNKIPGSVAFDIY